MAPFTYFFKLQERFTDPLASSVHLPITIEPSALAQSQYDVNVAEGRSLPNVLKRLSNLIALRNVVCIL